MISDATPVVCKIYYATGLYIGSIETTKANAAADAKSDLNLPAGIYILVLSDDIHTETLKLQL